LVLAADGKDQSIPNMYRFGSIDSGIFNADQTWDSAMSLDDFDGMAGFADNDASQPAQSGRLDKAGREPNKAVDCTPSICLQC
jgi:hypothetical protein